MKALVACEFTGTVREALLRHGFDAHSCDLRPSLIPTNRHIIDDVRNHLNGWDLIIIAHPPCTRLCNSGVRWLNDPSKMKNPGEDFTDYERSIWPDLGLEERKELMQLKLRQGAELFSDLWNAPCPRVACENPIMHKHAKPLIRNYQDPAQFVQPWMFGDFETKRTGLWLRGLDPLVPTYNTAEECRVALGLPEDAKPEARVHNTSPGPNRGLERSKFFEGIAEAMASQWGSQSMEQLAA